MTNDLQPRRLKEELDAWCVKLEEGVQRKAETEEETRAVGQSAERK